jgi:hypothetical protein
MARRVIAREELRESWPKAMAIRRLKDAAEEISNLEGLNHRDLTFHAWHENLSEIFRRNWRDEPLPFFSESRIRMPGEPAVTGRDVAIYSQGLAKTRAQIERILRNERELAEAQADANILEIFLPPGTQHDAYQEIRQIISSAKQELVVVDNYVDTTLFALLTNSNRSVAIKILTFSTPSDFALEARKFIQQHGHALEVKKDKNDFHDRFVLLDGVAVFHLGHSIKDAGTKAMMIHRLEDQRNILTAVQAFQAAWTSANSFPI